MRGVIFAQTLRRNWLQALGWGLGIGMLGLFILAMLPNVEMIEQYQRLMAALPPAVLAAFGMSDISQLASAEGFIGFAYFSYVMMLVSAYAVVLGMNVTAVEEDRGILDVLMSAPVSRAQLMIEKFLAYLLLMVITILLTFGGFVIGSAFSVPVDLGLLFTGTLNMIPAALTVFGFTVLMGALLRTRTTALAVSVGFVVVSYFIEFIGSAASDTAAAALRLVSYYNYYGGGDYMTTGIQWGNVLLLIVVGVGLFSGGVFLFQRRDIGL